MSITCKRLLLIRSLPIQPRPTAAHATTRGKTHAKQGSRQLHSNIVLPVQRCAVHILLTTAGHTSGVHRKVPHEGSGRGRQTHAHQQGEGGVLVLSEAVNVPRLAPRTYPSGRVCASQRGDSGAGNRRISHGGNHRASPTPVCTVHTIIRHVCDSLRRMRLCRPIENATMNAQTTRITWTARALSFYAQTHLLHRHHHGGGSTHTMIYTRAAWCVHSVVHWHCDTHKAWIAHSIWCPHSIWCTHSI